MTADQTVTNLPQLLQAAARQRPHAVAYSQRQTDGTWIPTTWQEIWRDVQQRAIALRRMGLARGDRLAILARTCPAWQIADMAGLLAGAAIVGVEPHASEDQIAFILKHAEVTALIVDTSANLAKVPHDLRSRLKFVVQLKGSTEDNTKPVVCWREMLMGADVGAWREAFPSTDDPATLLYTAGTTGTPKGILYTHMQVLAGCWAIREIFSELGEDDSTVCWLPMAHLFQRMINLVTMTCGVKTFFVEDPREILSCIQETQPSVFIAVPRFYEKVHEGIQQRLVQQTGWRRRLIEWALAAGRKRSRCLAAGRKVPWTLRLRHAVFDRLVLSKIRQVMGGRIQFMITGAAPTAPWLLEYLHSLGWLVLEAYGLSENTVPIAMNRLDACRFGSVGRPTPRTQLRFAEDGELFVKGPGVFTGYHKDEQRGQRFTVDGFYRTGDYGRLDADGFLYLLGRKTEIIKTSTGWRISPAQVEAVYRRSRHLDQIVVFGEGRKYLVALVSLNSASQANEEEIHREMELLGRELAPHERIRAFSILPRPLSITEGELTPTLKLKRQTIAKLHAERIEQLYQDLERKPLEHPTIYV